MNSLIIPKGNGKKEMRYEQTHKIFLCFFGAYLIHKRSGLCNVNFWVKEESHYFKEWCSLNKSFDLPKKNKK